MLSAAVPIRHDRLEPSTIVGGNLELDPCAHAGIVAEPDVQRDSYDCISALAVEDPRHSVHEPRYHALGRSEDDRRMLVTFTLRRATTRIRVISARDMSRKERARYAQEG